MTDDPRVQHDEPPLTWLWLWDLYPLVDGAWGNIQYPMAYFADWHSEPGSAIAVRRWVTGPGGAAFQTEYTPADDYITEAYNGRHATYNGLYQDEDRQYYWPTPEDLARVKSIFPTLRDPANPSWLQVEAELIEAGRSPDELRRMTAPALICLLSKSHDVAEDDEQQADPKAPFMPAGWFKDEFGLTADALRGQARRGHLARTKRGRWNLYSVPDAMAIWPELVIYGPNESR